MSSNSVVNFGANPATSAQLNSLSAALEVLAEVDPEQARSELRSGGEQVLQRLERARETVLALHQSTKPQQKKGRLLSVADPHHLVGDPGPLQVPLDELGVAVVVLGQQDGQSFVAHGSAIPQIVHSGLSFPTGAGRVK